MTSTNIIIETNISEANLYVWSSSSNHVEETFNFADVRLTERSISQTSGLQSVRSKKASGSLCVLSESDVATVNQQVRADDLASLSRGSTRSTVSV